MSFPSSARLAIIPTGPPAQRTAERLTLGRSFVFGGAAIPIRVLHSCSHPGCPTLVPRGASACREHQRPNPRQRGYDQRWATARLAFLALHPTCQCTCCDACGERAVDVDHIVPHRGDQALFWDENNWQGLSHRCHSIKTRREGVGV